MKKKCPSANKMPLRQINGNSRNITVRTRKKSKLIVSNGNNAKSSSSLNHSPSKTISVSKHNVHDEFFHYLQLMPVAKKSNEENAKVLQAGHPSTSAIHGERSFKCVTCLKTLSCQSSLNRHMLTHQEEKRSKCPKCPDTFNGSQLRYLHIESEHKEVKLFQCFMCKYFSSFIQHLQMHMTQHSGSKPFLCVECGKQFTTKSSVKRHMRTHTQEKPFPCIHCGQAFAQSTSRNYHQTVCRKRCSTAKSEQN